MLNKEKLDILDICLPTPLHVDCAVTAMKRGIHVICEKPLSLKTEEIERAYLTAHQYGVCFMTAQVLRFWPEYELSLIHSSLSAGTSGPTPSKSITPEASLAPV